VSKLKSCLFVDRTFHDDRHTDINCNFAAGLQKVYICFAIILVRLLGGPPGKGLSATDGSFSCYKSLSGATRKQCEFSKVNGMVKGSVSGASTIRDRLYRYSTKPCAYRHVSPPPDKTSVQHRHNGHHCYFGYDPCNAPDFCGNYCFHPFCVLLLLLIHRPYSLGMPARIMHLHLSLCLRSLRMIRLKLSNTDHFFHR
jgi:hypothetical protein